MSKRKQALTARMEKLRLYWDGQNTKYADGFYHVTWGSGWRPQRLRTLDEVTGYVVAIERAAEASFEEAGDIICDFWADLAA